MKLKESDIKEIQRLFIEGTSSRELARCYGVDANTIRYHCQSVIDEPIRRLEMAEIIYLVYVQKPLGQYINIEDMWQMVEENKEPYPRLSRMTRMRFAQVFTRCLNSLGWERFGNNSRSYTFSKPGKEKPVLIEW